MIRPAGHAAARSGTAGFTLVEGLVALALFALIGVAGFAMLDQVLRTQRQTEGRLETLAAMQRAMYMITLDFTQTRAASLTEEPGPQGPAVTLRRSAADPAQGTVMLRYALQDGVLMREVTAGPGTASGPPAARQQLIAGVSAVEWRYYAPGQGWVSGWPPPGGASLPGQPVPNPQAVAVTLTLQPGPRELRRVVLLPATAR